MRVWAVHEPERQSVRVYVMLRGNDDGSLVFAVSGDALPTLVAPGAEPPIWARLDERIAAAIGEALVPGPDFGERHLDDALATRDRLLGLVERIVDADIAREAR